MYDYEPSAELIKQGTKEYTLSSEEGKSLRETLDQMRERTRYLEGPDAPKTPTGRRPASVERDLKELRAKQAEIIRQLQDAPPAPKSFERVLVDLTAELDKLVEASRQENERFDLAFQQNPAHALRYYGAGVVVAHVQAQLAQKILDYAHQCIEDDGHTVEVLESIRERIGWVRDHTLNATLNKVAGGTHYWTLPAEQLGRVRFVEHMAWPLLHSQRGIDAYREYLAQA